MTWGAGYYNYDGVWHPRVEWPKRRQQTQKQKQRKQQKTRKQVHKQQTRKQTRRK